MCQKYLCALLHTIVYYSFHLMKELHSAFRFSYTCTTGDAPQLLAAFHLREVDFSLSAVSI